MSEDKEPEVVTVACRAKVGSRVGCGGQKAQVTFTQKVHPIHGGGTFIRYVCVDCKRPFQIRF
jgi:hypothetical protein